MEEFEELVAEKVFKVTYSDGSVVVYNLGSEEFVYNGRPCAPYSFIRI